MAAQPTDQLLAGCSLMNNCLRAAELVEWVLIWRLSPQCQSLSAQWAWDGFIRRSNKLAPCAGERENLEIYGKSDPQRFLDSWVFISVTLNMARAIRVWGYGLNISAVSNADLSCQHLFPTHCSSHAASWWHRCCAASWWSRRDSWCGLNIYFASLPDEF